jgi:phytoene dehydrogenase-like protein
VNMKLTIVGGGLSGLVAAIAAAERGVEVELFEARKSLGGRARTNSGDFRANLGAHAFWHGGVACTWLHARSLLPPLRRSPLTGARFYYRDRASRLPPRSFRKVWRLRGKRAPVDESFRAWVTRIIDAETAAALSNAAGVFTYYHDPGALSAAFVAERGARLLTPPLPNVYIVGGWQTLVDVLERRARDLGVVINRASRVGELSARPVIVATTHEEARKLLPGANLSVTLTRVVCLDVGVRRQLGDPFVVSDLEFGGWLGRYSKPDPTLAPKGHDLIQGHMPIAPDEPVENAVAMLETVADAAFAGWYDRTAWRRQQVMDGQVGAVDLPGHTWRDRPQIEQGNGVFLAGDWVAAPGLLSEVAFSSAITAAEKATALLRRQRATRSATATGQVAGR